MTECWASTRWTRTGPGPTRPTRGPPTRWGPGRGRAGGAAGGAGPARLRCRRRDPGPADGRRGGDRGHRGRAPVGRSPGASRDRRRRRGVLMPGNSQRRGAIRKPGSKKGQVVGSGGQKPSACSPRARPRRRSSGPSTRRRARRRRRPSAPVAPARSARRGHAAYAAARATGATSEWVFGRNSVVEALRAGVPVTTMYVASRIDTDDRVREALKAAVGARLSADGGAAGRARPAERRRRAPGPGHPGAGVRVRPPGRPARRGRRGRRGAVDRRARRRDRPAQPGRRRALGRRRSAATAWWCPSAGRPG